MSNRARFPDFSETKMTWTQTHSYSFKHLCVAVVAGMVLDYAINLLLESLGLTPSTKKVRGGPFFTQDSFHSSKGELNQQLLSHYAGVSAFPRDISLQAASRYCEKLSVLCERWCEALRDFTGERNPPIALDVGCGVGGLVFELARAFQGVTGVDTDSRLINAANLLKSMGELEASIPQEGASDNMIIKVTIPEGVEVDRVKFLVADAAQLPSSLGVARVDCLVASLLLEHLPRAAEFLRTAVQFLTPGAIFVVASTFTWHGHQAELPSGHPFGACLVSRSERVACRDRVVEMVEETGLDLVAEEDLPVAQRTAEREWEVQLVTALVFKNRI